MSQCSSPPRSPTPGEAGGEGLVPGLAARGNPRGLRRSLMAQRGADGRPPPLDTQGSARSPATTPRGALNVSFASANTPMATTTADASASGPQLSLAWVSTPEAASRYRDMPAPMREHYEAGLRGTDGRDSPNPTHQRRASMERESQASTPASRRDWTSHVGSYTQEMHRILSVHSKESGEAYLPPPDMAPSTSRAELQRPRRRHGRRGSEDVAVTPSAASSSNDLRSMASLVDDSPRARAARYQLRMGSDVSGDMQLGGEDDLYTTALRRSPLAREARADASRSFMRERGSLTATDGDDDEEGAMAVDAPTAGPALGAAAAARKGSTGSDAPGAMAIAVDVAGGAAGEDILSVQTPPDPTLTGPDAGTFNPTDILTPATPEDPPAFDTRDPNGPSASLYALRAAQRRHSNVPLPPVPETLALEPLPGHTQHVDPVAAADGSEGGMDVGRADGAGTDADKMSDDAENPPATRHESDGAMDIGSDPDADLQDMLQRAGMGDDMPDASADNSRADAEAPAPPAAAPAPQTRAPAAGKPPGVPPIRVLGRLGAWAAGARRRVEVQRANPADMSAKREIVQEIIQEEQAAARRASSLALGAGDGEGSSDDAPVAGIRRRGNARGGVQSSIERPAHAGDKDDSGMVLDMGGGGSEGGDMDVGGTDGGSDGGERRDSKDQVLLNDDFEPLGPGSSLLTRVSGDTTAHQMSSSRVMFSTTNIEIAAEADDDADEAPVDPSRNPLHDEGPLRRMSLAVGLGEDGDMEVDEEADDAFGSAAPGLGDAAAKDVAGVGKPAGFNPLHRMSLAEGLGVRDGSDGEDDDSEAVGTTGEGAVLDMGADDAGSPAAPATRRDSDGVMDIGSDPDDDLQDMLQRAGIDTGDGSADAEGDRSSDDALVAGIRRRGNARGGERSPRAHDHADADEATSSSLRKQSSIERPTRAGDKDDSGMVVDMGGGSEEGDMDVGSTDVGDDDDDFEPLARADPRAEGHEMSSSRVMFSTTNIEIAAEADDDADEAPVDPSRNPLHDEGPLRRMSLAVGLGEDGDMEVDDEEEDDAFGHTAPGWMSPKDGAAADPAGSPDYNPLHRMSLAVGLGGSGGGMEADDDEDDPDRDCVISGVRALRGRVAGLVDDEGSTEVSEGDMAVDDPPPLSPRSGLPRVSTVRRAGGKATTGSGLDFPPTDKHYSSDEDNMAAMTMTARGVDVLMRSNDDGGKDDDDDDDDDDRGRTGSSIGAMLERAGIDVDGEPAGDVGAAAARVGTGDMALDTDDDDFEPLGPSPSQVASQEAPYQMSQRVCFSEANIDVDAEDDGGMRVDDDGGMEVDDDGAQPEWQMSPAATPVAGNPLQMMNPRGIEDADDNCVVSGVKSRRRRRTAGTAGIPVDSDSDLTDIDDGEEGSKRNIPQVKSVRRAGGKAIRDPSFDFDATIKQYNSDDDNMAPLTADYDDDVNDPRTGKRAVSDGSMTDIDSDDDDFEPLGRDESKLDAPHTMSQRVCFSESNIEVEYEADPTQDGTGDPSRNPLHDAAPLRRMSLAVGLGEDGDMEVDDDDDECGGTPRVGWSNPLSRDGLGIDDDDNMGLGEEDNGEPPPVSPGLNPFDAADRRRGRVAGLADDSSEGMVITPMTDAPLERSSADDKAMLTMADLSSLLRDEGVSLPEQMRRPGKGSGKTRKGPTRGKSRSSGREDEEGAMEADDGDTPPRRPLPGRPRLQAVSSMQSVFSEPFGAGSEGSVLTPSGSESNDMEVDYDQDPSHLHPNRNLSPVYEMSLASCMSMSSLQSPFGDDLAPDERLESIQEEMRDFEARALDPDLIRGYRSRPRRPLHKMKPLDLSDGSPDKDKARFILDPKNLGLPDFCELARYDRSSQMLELCPRPGQPRTWQQCPDTGAVVIKGKRVGTLRELNPAIGGRFGMPLDGAGSPQRRGTGVVVQARRKGGRAQQPKFHFDKKVERTDSNDDGLMELADDDAGAPPPHVHMTVGPDGTTLQGTCPSCDHKLKRVLQPVRSGKVERPGFEFDGKTCVWDESDGLMELCEDEDGNVVFKPLKPCSAGASCPGCQQRLVVQVKSQGGKARKVDLPFDSSEENYSDDGDGGMEECSDDEVAGVKGRRVGRIRGRGGRAEKEDFLFDDSLEEESQHDGLMELVPEDGWRVDVDTGRVDVDGVDIGWQVEVTDLPQEAIRKRVRIGGFDVETYDVEPGEMPERKRRRVQLFPDETSFHDMRRPSTVLGDRSVGDLDEVQDYPELNMFTLKNGARSDGGSDYGDGHVELTLLELLEEVGAASVVSTVNSGEEEYCPTPDQATLDSFSASRVQAKALDWQRTVYV